MLTKRQIYEIYYEGPEATVRLIENLLSHLADVEKIVGYLQRKYVRGPDRRTWATATECQVELRSVGGGSI